MTARRRLPRSSRRARIAAVLLAVAATVGACSGAGAGDGQGSSLTGGAPLGSGQAGDYHVAISSKPGPPATGSVSLDALVTDTAGTPVADAAVTFDIDMTNMNMGRDVVTATPTSGGHYAGDLFFNMPGPWRVIVGISRGGATSSVQLDFMVQ